MEQQGSFFILKKVKYLESDLILHALSSLGEKKSFIARGALKSRKRFGGGVLEPTHQALLTYSQGRGELNLLKEAQMIHDFSGIRRSYDTLEFALKVVECIEKVSQEGDVHSEVMYNLLGHTMKAIEKTEHLDILKVQFFLKFFLQQGVLEPEAWMTPFLKIPIQSHMELVSFSDEAKKQLRFLERKVDEYIHRAGF